MVGKITSNHFSCCCIDNYRPYAKLSNRILNTYPGKEDSSTGTTGFTCSTKRVRRISGIESLKIGGESSIFRKLNLVSPKVRNLTSVPIHCYCSGCLSCYPKSSNLRRRKSTTTLHVGVCVGVYLLL